MPVHHVDSERGFRHYDAIETRYGHVVSVYESSAASEPCLWVRVELPQEAAVQQGMEPGEQAAHMTLDQAVDLRDTLSVAIRDHYQVRPR